MARRFDIQVQIIEEMPMPLIAYRNRPQKVTQIAGQLRALKLPAGIGQ
jgi:hypothetical protein